MGDYVRLRAPSKHGQILEMPELSVGTELLESNLKLGAQLPPELDAIRALARSELPQLAFRYSSGYLDACWLAEINLAAENPIVMSGHQPSLFHPGVWFKNFALSGLANQVGGLGINLIVDNALCGSSNVQVPKLHSSGACELVSIAIDQHYAAVPCEMRPIQCRATFESFEGLLAAAISDAVEEPIVRMLWKEVLAAAQIVNSMPASLAAGRHRLENAHGLRTLELPVSLLSSSQAFATFFSLIVEDANRFASVHNEELANYRLQHRIRSSSHPVPELIEDDVWQEIPFWVWSRDQPVRRRLFSRIDGPRIHLSDRQGWNVTVSRSAFVDSFQELNQIGAEVCIRPRALATTMFARIFASDLFIHGIGGAKYDQLNDDIIRRFLNVDSPGYFITTATMRLPFEYEESTTRSLNDLKVQLRNTRYHP